MGVVVGLLLAAWLMQHPETMSLLDEPLYPPQLPKETRARLETELTSARAAYAKDPTSPDAALVLAQADTRLGRVGDALELLTRAIEAKPDDSRLLLERARDLVVFRKFDAAERDLRKVLAAASEANCSLGLVLYLKGEFTQARESYGKCADPGIFAYLSDHRAGPSAMPRPAIPVDASTAEPDIRLPGSTLPRDPKASATLAAKYLDASDDLASRKTDAAKALLKNIVEKHRNDWMDPVYIAAEADYARMLKAEGKKPNRKKKKD
jgi:tetratricopeptide (TPR) repeat protein